MINISEPPKPQTSSGFINHALWQLPFRSFFILGALASLLSIAAWVLSLNGLLNLNTGSLIPTTWHAHEMIFGFGLTIAIGFVLTAVQTWTGHPSITGAPVIALVGLWLLIRVCLWLNTETSILIAILSQLIWWFAVIAVFSHLVFKAVNRRNYVFIPLFSIIAAMQLTVLVASYTQNHILALHLSRAAVIMFTVVITLIGGRVIPFFTVRGAQTEAITAKPIIELAILPCSILAALNYLISYFLPTTISTSSAYLYFSAGLFMIVGIIHVVRLSGWKSLQTFKVPLLWSLHFPYLAMALGLVFIGLTYIMPSLLFSTALHFITVGTIGVMILSMMSRVSLGHTGRMLQVKPIISVSFLLMIIATITRVVLPLIGFPLAAWNLSAITWGAAFLCFIVVYFPILSAPRVR